MVITIHESWVHHTPVKRTKISGYCQIQAELQLVPGSNMRVPEMIPATGEALSSVYNVQNGQYQPVTRVNLKLLLCPRPESFGSYLIHFSWLQRCNVMEFPHIFWTSCFKWVRSVFTLANPFLWPLKFKTLHTTVNQVGWRVNTTDCIGRCLVSIYPGHRLSWPRFGSAIISLSKQMLRQFLPHLFQVIIHVSPCHSNLPGLRFWQCC